MQRDQPTSAAGLHHKTHRGPLRTVRLGLRLLAVSCFALLIFVVTAAVSMPVNIITRFVSVPPQVQVMSGSVWDGQGILAGGLTLDWRGNWRSLIFGRMEFPLTLRGDETLLNAVAFASVLRFGIRDIQGRAGPDLLALVPDAQPCRGVARVSVDEISWSRRSVISRGQVAIRDAECVQGEVEIPQVTIELTTEPPEGVATARLDDASRDLLGSVRIDPDRWMKLRIEPAGARLFPGLPNSAPLIFEMPIE